MFGQRFTFTFLIIIFTLIVGLSDSDGAPSAELSKTNGALPLKFEAGFFAHFLVNPGAIMGLDVPFLERKRHELFVPTSAVFYVHPENSRVVMLNSGLGYRWHSKKAVFVTTSLRLGYMHSFVDGDLYREENGKIVEVRDRGRPAFAPYFDLGVGVHLFKDKPHQFSPFFKIMAFGQYPYNGYLLPKTGWQIGLAYRFKPKKADS
jgi:hypothetical protein